MKLNFLYKHENCLDVAIQPVELIKEPLHLDYVSVQVNWFNVHLNQLDPLKYPPDNMGIQEVIKIKKRDLFKWRLYEIR